MIATLDTTEWAGLLPAYETFLQATVSDATRRDRLRYARRIADAVEAPDRITEGDLFAMLARHRAGWTRTTYFGHMRSLCAWLVRVGVLDVDPTAGMRRPRSSSHAPRPLTPAEVDRALGAATASSQHMLLLGLLAGLRASEAAAMHSGLITEHGITVTGKGGKVATLPAHPRLVEIAEGYEGYWVPGRGVPHVRAHAVSERTTRLFSRLGIEGSFHRCRHYYGTSLLRAGVNIRVIQELMRHSSLATTAAYLGVAETEKRDAVFALTTGDR